MGSFFGGHHSYGGMGGGFGGGYGGGYGGGMGGGYGGGSSSYYSVSVTVALITVAGNALLIDYSNPNYRFSSQDNDTTTVNNYYNTTDNNGGGTVQPAIDNSSHTTEPVGDGVNYGDYGTCPDYGSERFID